MEGEPIRVSVCHCTACRVRTGSVFSAQARFPADAVRFGGEWAEWEGVSDSGTKASYRWCRDCGSTVAFVNDTMPDTVAIWLGAIVEGSIPTPGHSVYEERMLPWVGIVGDDIVRYD